MPEFINCPVCGKKVREGSTFCIECGARLAGKKEEQKRRKPNPKEDETEEDELTELEKRMLGLLGNEEAIYSQEPSEQTRQDQVEATKNAAQSSEESTPDLEWDVRLEEETISVEENEPQVGPDTVSVQENTPQEPSSKPPKQQVDLSWDVEDIPEMEADQVQEGMPFEEVEPPEVKSSGPAPTPKEAKKHLFPEDEECCAREAVSHLFPQGRGVTDNDFIDVVVGTPRKISVEEPMKELEQPTCPSCGSALTSDGFEYPPYVYEAMGKARIEHGEELLEKNEHEEAIESFEKAKMLYERANDEKKLEKCREKIDEGYESMAEFHYDQAEVHKKNREYEWAIVQYRKAREIYMFTTKRKERAKCAEKVRECYVDWGEELEERGDYLAKEGRTREALAKYQKAAEKYKQGEDDKHLKGLEKKIREA
jgi:predicted negative regulator of RcsB-dependent stress response